MFIAVTEMCCREPCPQMQNGKIQKATPNGPKRDGGAYTRGIHPHGQPVGVGWMEWIAYKGLNKWQEIWKRKRKRKGAEKKVTIFALHELAPNPFHSPSISPPPLTSSYY